MVNAGRQETDRRNRKKSGRIGSIPITILLHPGIHSHLLVLVLNFMY